MRSASQISSVSLRPAATGVPPTAHGEHEPDRKRADVLAVTGITAAERACGRPARRRRRDAAGRLAAR